MWGCKTTESSFKLITAERTQSWHTVSPSSPLLVRRLPSGWRGRPAWSACPASFAGGDCLRAAGHRLGEGWRFSSSGQLAGRLWRFRPRGRCRGGTPGRPGTQSRSRGRIHRRRCRWRRSGRCTRRFQGCMTAARYPPCYSHKLGTRCGGFKYKQRGAVSQKGLKTMLEVLVLSLTDTLQVWIPKMIFSTVVTLSSSKLRTTRTLSRHLNASPLHYINVLSSIIHLL